MGKKRDWVRDLLVAALCMALTGAVFSGVCSVLWPVHWPGWVARVSAPAWFPGLLIASVALIGWVRRR